MHGMSVGMILVVVSDAKSLVEYLTTSDVISLRKYPFSETLSRNNIYMARKKSIILP